MQQFIEPFLLTVLDFSYSALEEQFKALSTRVQQTPGIKEYRKRNKLKQDKVILCKP